MPIFTAAATAIAATLAIESSLFVTVVASALSLTPSQGIAFAGAVKA